MNNSPAPLYLSAREAAGELSVSPATLYAYVSRGLIRSEPVGDSRTKRYRADDVRALKNRRAPPGEPRGLEGEAPVLDSAISTITAEGAIYRGVHAVALAQTAALEQVATLLWNANDSDPFAPDNLPLITPSMSAVFAATRDAAPIPRAVSLLALATDADPRAYNRAKEGRAAIGARIMRLVTAAVVQREPSARPLHKQLARAWTPADAKAEDLFRRALVLLADHELNASTYALRVASSTGISLYDAVIAGLVALKGPKHGGAGPLAAHMVARLVEGDVTANLRERVALGERIQGFGHWIYRGPDPRAEDLLAALARAGADPRLVNDVPALVTEATGLHANIDYALAVMMRMFGLPIGYETALFAIARTAGWIAHGIEQLSSGDLIRPRARYVGPAPGRAAVSR